MNNKLSSKQISKTGNFDSNLIPRQYILHLKASPMENKSVNPKLKRDQIVKEIDCSCSTLERHRNYINMLSLNEIPPKSHKRRQSTSHTNLDDNSNHEHDIKGPQVTSKDLQRLKLQTLLSTAEQIRKAK